MADNQTYIEKEVLLRIAKGDEEAFAQLFNCFKERVFLYALKWSKDRHKAEEITQEVFIALWENRSKVTSIKEPQAYLTKMASNKVYDLLRSSLARDKILDAIKSRGQNTDFPGDEWLMAKESAHLIEQALLQLSPQKRKIFIMNKTEGKTPVEIAKQLELTPSTVRSHLADSIAFIRIFLERASLFVTFCMLHQIK